MYFHVSFQILSKSKIFQAEFTMKHPFLIFLVFSFFRCPFVLIPGSLGSLIPRKALRYFSKKFGLFEGRFWFLTFFLLLDGKEVAGGEVRWVSSTPGRWNSSKGKFFMWSSWAEVAGKSRSELPLGV